MAHVHNLTLPQAQHVQIFNIFKFVAHKFENIKYLHVFVVGNELNVE